MPPSTNTKMSDCPICMGTIEDVKNCITTECNHCFHANCLMQNIARNGFVCPYCRTTMIDVPEVSDYSDSDSDIESYIDYDNELLAPELSHVVQQFIEKGVTYKELVDHFIGEYTHWILPEYREVGAKIYKTMDDIIHEYNHEYNREYNHVSVQTSHDSQSKTTTTRKIAEDAMEW